MAKKYKCSRCGRKGHNKASCKNKKKKTPVRKKKSKKKKTSRKSNAVTYMVNASYSSKKWGWGELDGKIAKAAKRGAVGSGTLLSTGYRDLDFEFKREDAAKRAKSRINRLKGVKASIWPLTN